MAADLKEQGNALFKEGDFLKAAAAYTKAIKQHPQSHVLYSNRSAALLKLNKHAKALADAEECLKLDPAWDKGWMRKGMVLESQGQLQQALECFLKANEAAGGHADYTARIKVLRQKTGMQQKVAKTIKSAEEQAALAYAEAKLAHARDCISDLGSKFPPELHFLYPASSSSGKDSPEEEDSDDAAVSETHPGMREMLVRAAHAFDAPDVLTMFVGEMRQQAEQLQAAAVALIAPKSAVSFPQVQALIPRRAADDTTDKGQRGSSDGGSDGGSEAAPSSSSSNTVLNKMWFIRLRPDKPPSEPIEVNEEFGLLPPLLK